MRDYERLSPDESNGMQHLHNWWITMHRIPGQAEEVELEFPIRETPKCLSYRKQKTSTTSLVFLSDKREGDQVPF